MSEKRLSVVFPLYEDNDKTFVLLGKNAPGTKMPGVRNGFGGKCEDGESIIECAIRETQEETANVLILQKDALKKLGDVIMGNKIITFFVTYLDNKISLPDNSEMIDIQWFDLNDTSKFLFEMLSGDDKVIAELSKFVINKEEYTLFSIDKTNDQKLADQTKDIYTETHEDHNKYSTITDNS